MIQANRALRKNQTRRLKGLKWSNLYGEFSKAVIDHDVEVVDWENDDETILLSGICASFDDGEWCIQSPYQIGDILWVREIVCNAGTKDKPYWLYKADGCSPIDTSKRFMQPMFMPKAACRMWQVVKNVRIERVFDISEEDAIAEGIEVLGVDCFEKSKYLNYLNRDLYTIIPQESFAFLWQSIHGFPSPVYKKVNGKQVISHYEAYPFNNYMPVQLESKNAKGKDLNRKEIKVCPNPWVWVVEYDNIFEAPEGFL
jgi:hypothetical protein